MTTSQNFDSVKAQVSLILDDTNIQFRKTNYAGEYYNENVQLKQVVLKRAHQEVAGLVNNKGEYIKTTRFNPGVIEFPDLTLETKYIAIDRSTVQSNKTKISGNHLKTQTYFYTTGLSITPELFESLSDSKDKIETRKNLEKLKTANKNYQLINQPGSYHSTQSLSMWTQRDKLNQLLVNTETIKSFVFYPTDQFETYSVPENPDQLIPLPGQVLPNSRGGTDIDLRYLFTSKNGLVFYNHVNYREESDNNQYSIWDSVEFSVKNVDEYIDLKTYQKSEYANRQFMFYEVQYYNNFGYVISKIHRIVHTNTKQPFTIADIPGLAETYYDSETLQVVLDTKWTLNFKLFYKDTLEFADVETDDYSIKMVHHDTVKEYFPNGFGRSEHFESDVTNMGYSWRSGSFVYSGETISGSLSNFPNEIPASAFLKEITPENAHIAKMLFPSFYQRFTTETNYEVYRKHFGNLIPNADGARYENPLGFFGAVDEKVYGVSFKATNRSVNGDMKYQLATNLSPVFLKHVPANQSTVHNIMVDNTVSESLPKNTQGFVITLLRRTEINPSWVPTVKNQITEFPKDLSGVNYDYAFYDTYGTIQTVNDSIAQNKLRFEHITYAPVNRFTTNAYTTTVNIEVDEDETHNRLKYNAVYEFKSAKNHLVDLILIPFRGRMLYLHYKKPIALKESQIVTIGFTVYESLF